MKRILSLFIVITAFIGTSCSKEKVEELGEVQEKSHVVQDVEEEKAEEKLADLLSFEYLEELSLMDLAIMRNEIYARAGYKFTSNAYRKYFSEFDWYEPTGKTVEDKFTSLDRENMERIIWTQRKRITRLDQFADYSYSPENGGEIVEILGGDPIIISSKEDEHHRFTNDNVKLEVNNHYESFEYNSGWNDGVYLNFTNLTDEPRRGQMLITRGGTDVGCETAIYDYNSKTHTFKEYENFGHFFKKMLYGDNGYIYFCRMELDNETMEVDRVYDFKKNEYRDIFDARLKTQLTFINFTDRTPSGDEKYMYNFDIDYDNSEEQINIEPLRGEEGFTLTIKDEWRLSSITFKNYKAYNGVLEFIALKDSMYISVEDTRDFWNPVEHILKYDEDGIKEVANMKGRLVDYHMDGKLISNYDRVYGVPLGYFDIYKGEYVIDKDLCIGKTIETPHQITLFKDKYYTSDVHRLQENLVGFDSVAFPAHPFEKLEIIDVEEGKSLETRKKTKQIGTWNAPVKVRTEDGREGWILWKDGGEVID